MLCARAEQQRAELHENGVTSFSGRSGLEFMAEFEIYGQGINRIDTRSHFRLLGILPAQHSQ